MIFSMRSWRKSSLELLWCLLNTKSPRALSRKSPLSPTLNYKMIIYDLRTERTLSLPPRPVSSLVCFLRTLLELCTFTAILISIFYIQVATLLLLAYSELRLEFRRGSIVYFPSKNAERNILLKVFRNCLKLVYKFTSLYR